MVYTRVSGAQIMPTFVQQQHFAIVVVFIVGKFKLIVVGYAFLIFMQSSEHNIFLGKCIQPSGDRTGCVVFMYIYALSTSRQLFGGTL